MTDAFPFVIPSSATEPHSSMPEAPSAEALSEVEGEGERREESWFSLTTNGYRNICVYPRLSAAAKKTLSVPLCLCGKNSASKKPPALWRELTAGLGLLTSNRYTTASYCGMARNPWRMN